MEEPVNIPALVYSSNGVKHSKLSERPYGLGRLLNWR